MSQNAHLRRETPLDLDTDKSCYDMNQNQSENLLAVGYGEGAEVGVREG